jgi:hypothetical protein
MRIKKSLYVGLLLALAVGMSSVAHAAGYASGSNYTDNNGKRTIIGGTIDITGTLKLNGTAVTTTAAEQNYLDITTLGTGAASKAVVLDSAGDYTYPATGTIVYPSGATLTLASGSTFNAAGTFQLGGTSLTTTITQLNAVASDKTDFVQFLGLNNVLNYSAGTWTTTRVAQGDYVKRKTAGDDTTVIGIDLTPALRTTASKGFKLASIDVIFRNTTADLDAHTLTLDKITYTDSGTVTVTSVPLTGSLGIGQDADPQIDNVTVTTPAFNVTDDSKYVAELTVNAAAGSVYDYVGVVLKYTRNDQKENTPC